MNIPWFVYILSNYSRTVFYFGTTNDLTLRLKNHRIGKDSNFAPKYNLSY